MTVPGADDIPLDGLAEVLRGWSGRGQLYEALAGIRDDQSEVRWDRRDIEGRAHRLMLAQLAPLLEAWPRSAADWLHALPAQSLRQRRLADTPQPGTDWVETRTTLGWPPEQFIVKDRSRIADQLMCSVLRWSIDQLAGIRHDAVRVEDSLRSVAEVQLRAAFSLRSQPPLDAAAGVRPAPADIRALSRSGWPWTKLAPVAEMLTAQAGEDLLTFARQHLLPDEKIRWRLFHLGVLGKLLMVLRGRGASVTSLRPLSGASSPGPAYLVELAGRRWDLWFEAAAIWGYYGQASPYQALVGPALGHSGTPLGVDILLIRPGEQAYALECKYGKLGYIAREGYLQAMTYAQELQRHHVENVASYVVGPDPKLNSREELAWDDDMIIGLIGPRHLESLAF
jgi:hypothetical protein